MKENAAQNRGIEEMLFQQIEQRITTSPTMKTLGISVVYLGPGKTELKMKARPEFMNSIGVLQGGFTCAIADASMGFAVQTRGVLATTLDLNINYIAPIHLGTELTAQGNVLHCGSKTAVCESALYDEQGKLVVKARATFFVISKL